MCIPRSLLPHEIRQASAQARPNCVHGLFTVQLPSDSSRLTPVRLPPARLTSTHHSFAYRHKAIITISSTCSLRATSRQMTLLTMHYTALSKFMTVAVASRSVILEAPDDNCGYLNGMEQTPFGCLNVSEKCAIYYPTSSMTAPDSMLPMITPAPQPSVVCYEPSRGDCIVQPTACVDTLGDCTGTCSNDPMTLKCTVGPHLHCNRAHFESPLSFRNIWDMDSGLRSTDAPADGWFCGTAAIPVQQADASHSKTASTAHISHSSVSVTTTLSVTITLSRPGQTSGSPPMSSKSAIVVSEYIDCEDDALSRDDDCCYDEQDPVKPCYNEARRARLQQRRAIGSSTTAATPVAAPKDAIGRGSAIVSTAYIGQTNRPPLVEATRPWNIILPTAVATSTTETDRPQLQPFPRNGKGQRNVRGIIIGAVFGGLAMIAIVCCACRNLRNRLSSRRQQLSTQHQDGHELAGHTEHVSKRQENYLQYTKNLVSIKDRAEVASQQIPPHRGHTREQSGPIVRGQPFSDFEGLAGLAFGVPPGPAPRRHQQAFPEAGEAYDGDEEDLEPQSEESLEQEAYENAMGLAATGRRNRAHQNVL